MILTLTIGLIFVLIISGYFIYACDAAPTVVTLIMIILTLSVPLLHDTEKMLFAGIFYGTTCIVLILNTIRMDINELKEHEKSQKKQQEENAVLKKKILDYFNQGYLIIDKFKGFKYTNKSIDDSVNVDFIEQICEVKSCSNFTKKIYIIKYNHQGTGDKYSTNRVLQVQNIKDGKKLY